MEAYVYHATYEINRESIEKDGLQRCHKTNWSGMYMADALFFAFTPKQAMDYCQRANGLDDKSIAENIVVFAVPVDRLDMDEVGYDYNNYCESLSDINSLAYHKDVPPEDLKLLTHEEIDKFDESAPWFEEWEYGTDAQRQVFENIAQTFEEEIGSR